MIVADDLGARTFAAVVWPEKPLVGELESVFEKRAAAAETRLPSFLPSVCMPDKEG